MATRPLIPYLRKSSGEDPEQSRERQRRAIRAWAERNGEQLATEVWEGHVSGSKPWQERALGRAIEACECGEASGIVVEEQSRLSRGNQRQTAEVWDALERAGARLVCTEEGLDTAVGDQELNFTLKAALAREQWKQYRRRVQSAKRLAVERGVHIGPIPFGYTRKPHQPLQVDPKKAEVVRRAFELRATGANHFDVMRLLDELAPGGPSGKGAWNRSTVHRLLGNRVYLGEARGSDGPPNPDAHEAIVDPETFAVCRALARRYEPAPTRSHSLLAGLVFCGACGGALFRSSMAGGYRVYRCSGRSARGVCPAPTTAMADALERLVDDAVSERLSELRLAMDAAEPDNDDERVSELRRELVAAQERRAPFEDPDYVAALGLDAAKRALAKVDAEIAALEDELAERLAARRPTTSAAGEVVGFDDWKAWFTDLAEEPSLVERVASGEDARDVVLDRLRSVTIPGFEPTSARDLYESLRTLDDPSDPRRRHWLPNLIDRIVVSRGKRGDLAGRTRIVWKGEDAPPRPSRGRK